MTLTHSEIIIEPPIIQPSQMHFSLKIEAMVSRSIVINCCLLASLTLGLASQLGSPPVVVLLWGQGTESVESTRDTSSHVERKNKEYIEKRVLTIFEGPS